MPWAIVQYPRIAEPVGDPSLWDAGLEAFVPSWFRPTEQPVLPLDASHLLPWGTPGPDPSWFDFDDGLGGWTQPVEQPVLPVPFAYHPASETRVDDPSTYTAADDGAFGWVLPVERAVLPFLVPQAPMAEPPGDPSVWVEPPSLALVPAFVALFHAAVTMMGLQHDRAAEVRMAHQAVAMVVVRDAQPHAIVLTHAAVTQVFVEHQEVKR